MSGHRGFPKVRNRSHEIRTLRFADEQGDEQAIQVGFVPERLLNLADGGKQTYTVKSKLFGRWEDQSPDEAGTFAEMQDLGERILDGYALGNGRYHPDTPAICVVDLEHPEVPAVIIWPPKR